MDVYYAIGSGTLKQIAFIISGIGLMLLALLAELPAGGLVRVHDLLAHRAAAGAHRGGLGAGAFSSRHIPLVRVVRSTRRWVGVGAVSIQPSEFMKLALLLALAKYLRFAIRTGAGGG